MKCPGCQGHINPLRAVSGEVHCAHCGGTYTVIVRHKLVLVGLLAIFITATVVASLASFRAAFWFGLVSGSVLAGAGFYALINAELETAD